MKNKILKIIQITMGLIGVILLIYNAGWLASLGVFLMIWSNNFKDIIK